MGLIEQLENELQVFRKNFSRKAQFEWFVVFVIGFLAKTDSLGISSIVRALKLNENSYESLQHFFFANGYLANELVETWYSIMGGNRYLFKYNGRNVVIGDGTKVPKTGEKIIGTYFITDGKEEPNKPKVTFGNFFGITGLVAENNSCRYCIPAKVNIQGGIKPIADWKGAKKLGISNNSHVVQMIDNIADLAKHTGPAYAILDRFFGNNAAIKRTRYWNRKFGSPLLHLVTRPKRNYVAYEVKPRKKKGDGPGRIPFLGKKRKIFDTFKERAAYFVDIGHLDYIDGRNIKIYQEDMRWGEDHTVLRFAFIQYVDINGKLQQEVFMTTDLTLSALQIIELYNIRWSIECSIRTMKQDFNVFSHRCWSKYAPCLSDYDGKSSERLVCINDEREKQHILRALGSISLFVSVATIAAGLAMMLALDEDSDSPVANCRYTRSSSKQEISVGAIIFYIRESISCFVFTSIDSQIARFIRSKLIGPDGYNRKKKEKRRCA